MFPQNEDDNMITIVEPISPTIFRVVQESRLIMGGSLAKEELIDNTRLISSKCQPPNLKRILTKTNFNDQPFKDDVTRCGNKRWGYCKFVQTGNNVFFHRIGINCNIKFDMTYSTEHLLYVLTWSIMNTMCNKQAVWERNRVHKQQFPHCVKREQGDIFHQNDTS